MIIIPVYTYIVYLCTVTMYIYIYINWREGFKKMSFFYFKNLSMVTEKYENFEFYY